MAVGVSIVLSTTANLAMLSFLVYQAPWEIYRKEIEANTIINAGRIVDTYSKSGDVGAYSTYIGLVPDYNIGMTILAAGDAPGNSVYAIRDLLVDIYVSSDLRLI
jgi:hypothetical protein